jgi:exosortase
MKKEKNKYIQAVASIFDYWTLGDYIILLGTIIMFTRTFFRLITVGWKNADYTHAYFILPICIWLVLRRKDVLQKSSRINLAGGILFFLSIACYAFSVLNEFMFLEAFSFVLMMWAIFKIRFTKDSFHKLLFPMTYLLFLIPPPLIAIDAISMPLKSISTVGAYFMLKSFHFPVAIFGVILNVGGKELFIADACSGFRSITTLLALSAIYAYMSNISLLKKWIVFLSVIPFGILGNMVRISTTGLMAYYFGSELAEGFFHGLSGVIVFIVAIFGLILLTKSFSRSKNEASDD